MCAARDKTDNKKLFGFSFARLMESGGATLRDGTHELHIYKCEERARLDPAVYLALPSGARDAVGPAAGAPGFARSAKEGATVHTLLCSTKLTQNGEPQAVAARRSWLRRGCRTSVLCEDYLFGY